MGFTDPPMPPPEKWTAGLTDHFTQQIKNCADVVTGPVGYAALKISANQGLFPLEQLATLNETAALSKLWELSMPTVSPPTTNARTKTPEGAPYGVCTTTPPARQGHL